MRALRGVNPAVVAGIVIVLLIGAILLLIPGSGEKHVTAEFPRAISLYKGSDVKILGVSVGKVDEVDPAGHEGRGEAALRQQVQGARRREGRGDLAVDRRRPVRPAHPGVHRRCEPGRQRQARSRPHCHAARARPDLRVDHRPDEGARARRGQQARRIRHRRTDAAAGLDRAELRRAGGAVQPDAAQPEPAHQDPRRQQGRPVRHRVRGREVHQRAVEERRHRTPVQRLAGQRRPAARRRAPGLRRRVEEPLGGAHRGEVVRLGEQEPAVDATSRSSTRSRRSS